MDNTIFTEEDKSTEGYKAAVRGGKEGLYRAGMIMHRNVFDLILAGKNEDNG